MSFMKNNLIWLDLRDSVLDLLTYKLLYLQRKSQAVQEGETQSLKETTDLRATSKTAQIIIYHGKYYNALEKNNKTQ